MNLESSLLWIFALVGGVITAMIAYSKGRLAEVRLDEFRPVEERAAEERLDEFRIAKVRLPNVRAAEFRLGEVRLAKIGPRIRMLLPPLIPGIYSLVNKFKMFFVCHV